MSAEKCIDLLGKKKYFDLAVYSKEQFKKEPENSIYLFYEAIAYVYIDKRNDAKQLLEKLYNKEKKPIYKIVIAMINFIDGDAEEGTKNLNEAIDEEDNIDELMLVFDIAIGEMLLLEGEKAIKRAIKKDKMKTVEALRDYFERLAANEKMTAEDRLDILDSLKLFEKAVKRI